MGALNDTAHEKTDPWQGALAAIAAPLRFAARHDFAHLERIKDLENTLRRAMVRAKPLAPSGQQAGAMQALVTLVPQADASASGRRNALRACLTAVEALQQGLVPVPPAAPKATATAALGARSAKPAAALGARAVKPAAAKDVGSAKPATIAAAAPASHLRSDASIESLRGVGPKAATHLASRGLRTVEALLRFLPRRYQGLDSFEALGALQVGAVASVQAQVHSVSYQQRRARRTLEVILRDTTGFLHLMWFRIPHRNFAEQFVRGTEIRAVGQVKGYRARMQIIHPEITVLEDAATAPAAGSDGIVPLYLEVEGMRPIALRKVMAQALPAAAELPDPLPERLRQKRQLVSLGEALLHLHQPPKDASVEGLNSMQNPWHGRLIYEELLFLQLVLLQQRANQSHGSAPAVAPKKPLEAIAREILPFTLTDAQSRVLQEVEADLHTGRPMQRLIQGDVGSGKTAVAFTAMAAVAMQGWQTALWRPPSCLPSSTCAMLSSSLASRACGWGC